MSQEDNVLFVRSGETSVDDVWDDSALIKAYDRAINLAKEEVSKRLGVESQTDTRKQKKAHSKKQNQQQKQMQKKWVVGSPCRAIYSEDGEYYEAVITKIFENTGTCTVKFIGYNNKETVELCALIESDGLQSQIAQQKEATTSQEENSNSMEYEQTQKVNGFHVNDSDIVNESKLFNNMYMTAPSFNPPMSSIPPAPPLPPQLMARLPETDADALSSMLMSWYISGFHTGYYHGLKQAKSNQEQKKK
ncbi:survival motor neuron protein [Trichogramma pretiosum]|uniref:survival motor neuron protein n=1 Tax=Trichogramma pretiosum TaxID=7493 RepID=UPI0006C9C22F|nr:survival motor neuron protein [Trichogramma pretiosum]